MRLLSSFLPPTHNLIFVPLLVLFQNGRMSILFLVAAHALQSSQSSTHLPDLSSSGLFHFVTSYNTVQMIDSRQLSSVTLGRDPSCPQLDYELFRSRTALCSSGSMGSAVCKADKPSEYPGELLPNADSDSGARAVTHRPIVPSLGVGRPRC